MRHDKEFPINNPVCNYLKEVWEKGWLDEYSDKHFLIRAIEARLDGFVGEMQMVNNNLNIYGIARNGAIDYNRLSVNFCMNFSIKLQHMAEVFGERQIKTFISDQLSAGKKNYSEDSFFQALSEVSILHFYLFRFRWEKAEYEPPVSKHENNKNPEAKLIGRINCKPVSGKKSNIEVTVNIEVKTPQFPHETHSENTILIPAVLLSPEGRQQITTWCKEKHIIYLPPRVCKLVDFINSAAEKFSSPKENEFNILYINWSYRDYPKNSFLEAWSLLTNPHNGIFTNKTVGTSIGIKPEAYKRISAVVVYTESLEGLMFNDFRYVWQRNEAGTRFRMWVIDEQLRMSEEQDCSDILFNITGMNPSKPERILMCGTKTELENLSIFKEAHKIILTHLYQQNDFS